MENLDKLTAAGLPHYDLNLENLERKDWSQTVLGLRKSWPVALQCLVNSCILPIPHPAAIFWGSDLSIIHNLAWGKCQGGWDGQGARADDSYSKEAASSLRAAVRGRTVKVACRFFFEHPPDNDPHSRILLSTILDEHGKRQGVLAQVLRYPPTDEPSSWPGLNPAAGKRHGVADSQSEDERGGNNEDKDQRHLPARQLKAFGSQQTNFTDHDRQVDSKQTQLFQRFAELLPNGLAILDLNAEAVFVNDGFFKLTTNTSSKEFRAWPESIHLDDYERVMSEYRRAFSSREELRVEFRCAGESEEGSMAEWRLFLLRPLSEESEAGFICAVVDITEIKQAEISQEKAAADAQERKEQQERFIDMVSHEIRNPLSAVLHLAEEVKDIAQEVKASHDDMGSQVAGILDAADTILLCVSHQNTLVDDILSFSKLDSMMLSLVPREVRPKWEFSNALRVFNSEFKAKGIKFHYAMDVSYDNHSVDVVLADFVRMRQVLVNLMTNAIKFTSRKYGERKIAVSMGASLSRPTSYPPNVVFFGQDSDSFRIDSTMSSDWGGGEMLYIMVAVKDTGIGISADDQAKLFERFRQATPKTQENYGGSGLGLFISRKLCQLHGGDIGVSSKDGEGSTFGFFFKVRRSTGPREGERPPYISRTSGSSNATKRTQTPRPSYSRSNSALQNIKEGPNKQSRERPKIQTLTSHEGVDVDDVNDSLKAPPTEYRPEAHPEASDDRRFRETQGIAERIKPKRSSLMDAIEPQLPNLKEGETEAQARRSEGTSSSHSQESAGTRPALLLVEDNLINQKVLRRQLQARGFEVFVASNGQEAIDAVEERGRVVGENKDKPNYFDCILMDQEMPVKDGNAATMEIRELQEQGKAGRSPILGVSANVREAQTKSMTEAGMDAILSKPYKVDDLVGKIRTLLPKK